MNNFFDNQRIFTLIWKRKFHFVIVGVIAVVLSAIFSGPTFIRPMYKSTARVYPSNIGEMSEESKTEQMLEIINSNDVKLKMMESFPLHEDYKINKDDPQYLTYMFDIYNKNIFITNKNTMTDVINIANNKHVLVSINTDKFKALLIWMLVSILAGNIVVAVLFS